jgi:hypothetical protein
MPPETEVISCPACRHAVRIPTDWLGTTVQCPECQATFTAPRREGDSLTAAVLISASPHSHSPRRKPADSAIWIPAFGLMLLGVISLIVNGITAVEIARDPVRFEQRKKQEAEEVLKSMGLNQQAVGNNPGANWRFLAALSGWGILCGAASFAGGLGMALRKWYWLACLGSGLAIVNVAGCCCVPGAFFGVWALALLRTEETRKHFMSA